MNSTSSIAQPRSTFDWLGNVLALLATIAVNALANSLPLAGVTTGEVSALYPSLFTPAGHTFAIWSLIYIAVTAFVVYQALPPQRSNALLANISIWFKVSCIANCVWIVLWHYQLIPLTLLMMLLLLASLVVIYQRVHAVSKPASPRERWLLYVPFSLYLGWISVATIANVSAVQTALALNDAGLSAVVWTVLKLVLAGLLAAVVNRRYSDGVYALVFVWAAVGIATAQAANTVVLLTALALAGYCLVLAVSAFRAS
ncbi:MAG: tryptophan-rich sensory protein [Pseudomonadota bacterium]